MRILLDTHIFIWWHDEPERLSARAFALCDDPTNSLVLSVASIWEMQIKHQSGKLTLSAPLSQIIADQQQITISKSCRLSRNTSWNCVICRRFTKTLLTDY